MNKGFLNESREDFKSASLLLAGESYSQALYHFQQSVEKMCKYICLETGALKVSEMKGVSHDVFKAINKLSVFFQKTANTPGLNVADQIEIDLKSLTNFKNETEKVAVVSELIKTFSRSPSFYDKLDDETYTSSFVRIAKRMGLNYPESEIKTLEELEREDNHLAKKSINDVVAFFDKGINLLLFIFAYSIYTNHYPPDVLRYPSEKINEPSKYFNNNNIFILALPRMLETYNQYVLVHIDEINWSMFR